MDIILPVSGEANYSFLVFAGNRHESIAEDLSRLTSRVEALSGSLEEHDHTHGEGLASLRVAEWLKVNDRRLPMEHPHPHQWNLIVLRVSLDYGKTLKYIIDHDEIFQSEGVIR